LRKRTPIGFILIICLCIEALASFNAAAAAGNDIGINSLTSADIIKSGFNKNNEGEDFSIQVSPSSQTVPAGEVATYAVIIASIGGFDERVTLNVAGLPPGAKGTFSPKAGKPSFVSILTVRTEKSTPAGVYSLTVAGSGDARVHFTTASLIVSAGAKPDFAIAVSPPLRIIEPSQSANYTVFLTSLYSFSGEVSLSVSGIPNGATSSFSVNPVSLSPGEVANSTLTITTSATTIPGTYRLTVKGSLRYGGLTHSTSVALIVSGATLALSVTVETDKPNYSAGENVKILGSVKSSLEPVANADVSIQVNDPNGTSVHIAYVSTNGNGLYSNNFTLKSDAAQGTYTVYVTASKPGYRDGRGQTTFTVGQSSTPSITIVSVYTADLYNNSKTSFKPGETLIVWIVVQNSGADLPSGMIWVEVEDPNGVPVSVQFQIALIRRGSSVTSGFSVTLSDSAAAGTYEVKGFVSTGLISKGGKFLAAGQAAFTVS
jgi:uncharacterized membrane protein